MSITTDAWTSVSKAWLHGLAYLKANPGAMQQASGQSTYEQVVHHAHGSAGVWSQSLEASLHQLSIPVGEGWESYFEYDPLRSCSKWNPFTCFPAPKFLGNLVTSLPSSSSPLLILEMRPFLGAASIALANALSYGKRDGFVLSVDTWRANEGYVGIQQTNRAFPLPAVCANEGTLKGLCDDASYYQWARNVATGQVRGEARGAWEPKQHQWENVTARLVPLPLLSSKARGAAHWLGSRGMRPSLVYLNAPTVGIDFKQELEQSWKILGCGGSIAGAGYRLPGVQSAVVRTFGVSISHVVRGRRVCREAQAPRRSLLLEGRWHQVRAGVAVGGHHRISGADGHLQQVELFHVGDPKQAVQECGGGRRRAAASRGRRSCARRV